MPFICTKAPKATFSIQKRWIFLKCYLTRWSTPSSHKVVMYGGINKTALHELDKAFLNYIRYVLCAKSTTSNIIVFGECAKFPPSMYCHINITSWLHDLHSCDTSIIRTYRSYKLNFVMECYLKHVNNSKFRVALPKLRTQSHPISKLNVVVTPALN